MLAENSLSALFNAFLNEPRLHSPEHQEKVRRDGARAISDYIAGMTDRYAMREYRRIFGIGSEELNI